MICKEFKAQYNPGIDFWRFIFSLLIVFSHGLFLADKSKDFVILGRALLGVEFYFIVSGFLLIQTVYTHNFSILEFVKNKILKLLPYFIVAYVFCFLVWITLFLLVEGGSEIGKWQLVSRISKSIWELFWMTGSGIPTAGVNGTWWYLSSMLFAEWLLYPIIKKNERLFVSYIAPLSIFLLIGLLSRLSGKISGEDMLFFMNTRNYRAILEVCIGCIVFYLAYYLRKLRLKRWVLFVLSFIECVGYISVFVIAQRNYPNGGAYVDYQLDFVVLIILLVSVTITSSGQNILTQKFNNSLGKYLGNLGTCIYLVHWQCMKLILLLAPREWSYNKKLTILFLISISAAIATMHLAKWLKRAIVSNKFLIKQAFIRDLK